MKKGDIIIILSVLGLILVLSLFLFFGKDNGALVTVTRNSEVIKSVPLNEDTVIDIETNIIIVKDGKAFVSEANCKNQVCVNHKPITEKGEVIACLPNKVIIEIE
ncbi:MAG: NusG domain II-containing protein [Ruminococcaceae bacterium]|nr:NusG domain II-containing protein [Oscillospiraceae bacterium]